MKSYEYFKEKFCLEIDRNHELLIELNDDLADHPEESDFEYRSSQKIVDLLRGKGYEVEYPFNNLPTAFKAVYGNDNHKYKVALLTEYDALPGIGHACGHCVSGSISLLAGIAMAGFQDEMDVDVHIIGTPSEEKDGAKVPMAISGVFDIYDMAIMIHMGDVNQTGSLFFSMGDYYYTFYGKPSHAAAAPWDGINALNGAQLMVHAIDMLRQHVKPDVRIHCIYTEGGTAPGVVPEKAQIHLYARSLDKYYLQEVKRKIDDCARGAAIATQTTWDTYETAPPYDNLKYNATGAASLSEVFAELGIEENGDLTKIFGSSDVGNVSHVCPTFHPRLSIAPPGTAIHTKEFAECVKTDEAHKAIALGAKVIALHTAKIFTDENRIKKMKEDFGL